MKTIGALLLAAILASNLLSISRWTEERGVNDDLCYLRQAHLFQHLGLGGLDTSLATDDDGYLATKLRNLPGYENSAIPPCHPLNPVTNKHVIQYPPGTGFVLALFPSGFQVIPLFALCNIIVFLLSMAALRLAGSRVAVAGATIFGALAIYMMINPTKASYSMAPTMVTCGIAGLLTALLLMDRQRHRVSLAAVLGLLIGLAVDFRLANLFLVAGYVVYFAVTFLAKRNRASFLQGFAFASMFVVGLLPTLAANAINAGSPFSTTYGAGDAAPPAIDFDVIMSYLLDMQFVLILIAVVWTVTLWRRGAGNIALLVGANLAINVAFFVTHPVFTPYYTIPVSALSLWTLLFWTVLSLRRTAPATAQPRPA